MPLNIGSTELLILLFIVLLLFGAGRIGRLARELGQGIHDFRQALSEADHKSAADGE